MFKEPLYNAIARGDKTQTRRVVKIDSKEEIVTEVHNSENPRILVESDIKQRVIYPRYNVGETVYLKEPYQLIYKSWDSSGEPLELNFIEYKYDRESLDPEFIWKNKMFMPEKYARRFIKITNIRVERLQDISEVDILCEGVPPNVINAPDNEQTLRDTWWELWDSINKPPYSWADNPFNWVYEFELTEKPE